jgi:hypothetical protein
MIKTPYLKLSENVNKFWRLAFLVTSHAVWPCDGLDGNVYCLLSNTELSIKIYITNIWKNVITFCGHSVLLVKRMYSWRNQIGPKTESPGKPHLILFISEVLVLTLTNCWRFNKYDLKRFELFVKGIKMILFLWWFRTRFLCNILLEKNFSFDSFAWNRILERT